MDALLELYWQLGCRANRRLPLWPRAAPLARMELRGRSIAPSKHVRREGRAPDLCVVVSTHARAEPCAALLTQLDASLRHAGQNERSFVLVIEDPSGPARYEPVLELLAQRFDGRFAFLTASQKLGKPGRWFAYQTIFDHVRELAPALTLFLEDDVTFSQGFIAEALELFHSIQDAQRRALYLCAFDDDEPEGRWIRFARTELPGGRVRLTQWLDPQAFLVDRGFFELLHYELLETFASRFRRDPSRSSGIGEQLTRRLWGRGNIYQVCESLVEHGAAPSLLNPEARAARPLDNRKPEATLARRSAPRARVR